jgi:hypothetical protein
MRAREFVAESALTTDQKNAMPDTSSVGVPGTDIGPSNAYHKYRLGVHMAGSPEDLHPYDRDGVLADDMVFIGYSDADNDIIDNSVKSFGYKHKKLSSKGSRENADTHTRSPIAGVKKNRYGV